MQRKVVPAKIENEGIDKMAKNVNGMKGTMSKIHRYVCVVCAMCPDPTSRAQLLFRKKKVEK